MIVNNKPIANPGLVLREEFDDWAVLFDPDSGDGHGLNPTSVFIWKRLDGRHTVKDILSDMHAHCTDVPEEAEDDVREFLATLAERGYVSYGAADA